LKKLDLNLENDEDFYLYRDSVNKEFKVLTWALNEDYKYVDKLWNKIDVSENLWKVFNLDFTRKMDILRNSIDPSEIPNIVFHFDAQNIDWTNNSTFNDWDLVGTWTDITGNWNDATGTKKPEYSTGSINNFPFVKFDGTDILKITNNININNDNICGTDLLFREKSYAIAFKTWNAVSWTQYIYEQGAHATWYSFSIHDWDIYAWIYNNADTSYSCYYDSSQDWDSWHKFKSVNLWEALPDTIYYIMIVQDSTHIDSWWTYIDTNNTLKIYLNWELVDETDHVDPMPEHNDIGFWWVNEETVYPWDTGSPQTCSECDYFTWWIWEFISWNHALTQTEIRWTLNYFKERWLYGNQNIEYNVTELDSSKKYNY